MSHEIEMFDEPLYITLYHERLCNVFFLSFIFVLNVVDLLHWHCEVTLTYVHLYTFYIDFLLEFQMNKFGRFSVILYCILIPLMYNNVLHLTKFLKVVCSKWNVETKNSLFLIKFFSSFYISGLWFQ